MESVDSRTGRSMGSHPLALATLELVPVSPLAFIETCKKNSHKPARLSSSQVSIVVLSRHMLSTLAI